MVKLLIPPAADLNNDRYPMIVDVNGEYPRVDTKYVDGFANFLVTNKKYIYCYVDGRLASSIITYYSGNEEVKDIISVIKFVIIPCFSMMKN